MQFDGDGKEDQSGFGGWLEKRAKEKIGPTGDRGDLFLKTLIQNIAPMVLCCIPLFALVLKILYVFKRRFYIEHLVFALHTHAFVFLSTLLIIGIGFLLHWKAPPAFTPLVCTFLGFAVVIQLLVAIRKVYRQNWLATLFKFGLGSVIYVVMLRHRLRRYGLRHAALALGALAVEATSIGVRVEVLAVRVCCSRPLRQLDFGSRRRHAG